MAISIQDFYAAAQSGTRAGQPLVVKNGRVSAFTPPEKSGWTWFGSDGPTKEQNRASWAALASAFGRAAEYLSRYEVDMARERDKGSPLLIRHIEMIAVGAARVIVNDIPENLRQTHSALAAFMQARQAAHAYIGHCRPVAEIFGGPRKVGEYLLGVDLFRADKDKLTLERAGERLIREDDGAAFNAERQHLRHYHWLDLFAKTQPTFGMDEGEVVSGPAGQFYVVHKKIVAGGCEAYALRKLAKDSELPPVIFFRATVPNLKPHGLLSLMNNAHKNMGEPGYKAAREQLKSLVNDPTWRRENERFDAVGYSQGVAFLQRWMADTDQSVWKKMHRVVFFSGPSVEPEIAQAFSEMVRKNTDTREPLQLFIYRNQDQAGKFDIVVNAGTTQVGHGLPKDSSVVKVWVKVFKNVPPVGEPLMKRMASHAYRHFDHRTPQVEVENFEDVDAHLNNVARGSEVVADEESRLFWGDKIIYPILYCLLMIVCSLFYCIFGLDYFPKDKDKEPEKQVTSA